jgi:tyrosine-protein phosphatase SIW14
MIIKTFNSNPLIYRSNRPEPNDFAEIRTRKIKTILSLENDIDQVKEELSIASTYKLAFYNVPMSGIWKPKQEQLLLAMYIMEIVKYPLLIHCLHGVDRTGIVCAEYRVKKQGWSVGKAYQECLKYGHNRYLWFWKKALGKL